MADTSSYGSREDLVRRRRAGSSTQGSYRGGAAGGGAAGGGYYQPGRPMGYLYARGTPYEKKYFTKKLGFCCLFLAPPIIIVTLVLTLVPILYGIGNHALHTSVLSVSSANLTNIGNTSFPLVIEGQVRKTGIFPAHLYFREPVEVYWNSAPPNMTELHLGTMTLDYIGVAAGHGRVKQATTFYIDDVAGMGTFAQWLVSEEAFTWQLRCSNVHVEAFSFFPTFKNLVFKKDVTIPGINGFSDVAILDFQLPGDDPAGGITTQVLTQLYNPSPFGIEVGSLVLALYYDNVFLGDVMATGLNLTAGYNTVLVAGRLIPQTTTEELDVVGQLFTAYINGESSPVIARGISTTQADGNVVGWLQTGITALTIDIPLQAPTPITPITGIVIEFLSLIYSTETPYNPQLFSNDLVGTIALPFGFSLSIIDLSNTLNILYEGALVGEVDAPYSNSSTTLDIISAGETTGSIVITLSPSPLILPNNTAEAKVELIAFQNHFTYNDAAGFTVSGAAKALTDTPIGRVLLDGIKFEVDTGLAGLSGLRKYPTVINTVDVVGGFADGIELAIGTTLVNPSNLNLTIGDTTLIIENEVPLGNVTLPNLNLQIGRNDVNATSYFNPNVAPQGLETLNRFISGLETQLNITGFEGSSGVQPLAITLSAVQLNATLPALSQNLVTYANLTVLDTTGITNDIADSLVTIENPFTADLTITRIVANASSKGIFIASIDVDLDYVAVGHATTVSPVVPLSLNLYPPDIFGLLRSLVVQSGQDPTYLDGLVELGGYSYTPTTAANGNTPLGRRSFADEQFELFDGEDDASQMLMGIGSNPGALLSIREDIDEDDDLVKRASAYENHEELAKRLEMMHLSKRSNLYTGFDLPTYVDAAFAVATLDLVIESDATIGDYSTILTFSQNNVPLGTDTTLNLLLPVLALPIVQKIVDNAILNIDRVTILNPLDTSFTASIQGTITAAGPFDAVISFPDGLSISWNGQTLVTTTFPDVSLTGDTGASINVEVTAEVPSVDYLTTFTEYLLLQPSFIWSIAGSGLTVTALGITVPNITITKDVQLTGLNGLEGMVIINSFDLPSDSSAGGITLTADSTINNPAQVGVELALFGTNVYLGDILLGPAAATADFILQALAVTTLPLAGNLIEQTTTEGLAALSTVFTRFVQNENTIVSVVGDYAGPADVAWLNNGIKVLNVSVSLPAQSFEVIRLVGINQLSLFFDEETSWSPPTSSSNTVAHFFLPFAFPVDIVNVGGPFIANYDNQNAAVLNIPLTSAATTDVEARILTLAFNSVPFDVYSDAHTTFSQFLADTTADTQVTFNLNGAATANADTAAGEVTISGIPFSLDTNLLGLQNLDNRAADVTNLDVVHGYPTYLLITANTALYNPSAITIGAGDVSFAVLFEGDPIGVAIIDDIILVPGTNIVETQINYSPQGTTNTAAGQLLLENYVQNVTSDTIVAGTQETTDIASLVQALSGISLTAIIPPLEKQIVVEARLEVPKDIAQTGIASASVMIANPFTAVINILDLYALANYYGPSDYGTITLGTINLNLESDPLVNPGHTTTTSRDIDIALNIDPKNLIRFILTAAENTGTSLGPFPPFLQDVLNLADTTTTISPYPYDVAPPCDSGTQFDILGAILQLLKGLETSIPIQSTLKLDDYQTNLDFIQAPVPTDTDNTALYLVGPAAAPLIQQVVNNVTLFFNQANATSLTDEGFAVTLQGYLLTDAPADAYISFPDGIIVNWEGTDIATISLPPICSASGVGVPDLLTTGQLTITNYNSFVDFAIYILNNPSFTWTISSPSVTVQAVGITFSDVILTKEITLDVFNGLPGIVITYFDIPGETADSLLIAADANIPSPSALGVDLGTANFEIYFQGTDVGPIQATNLFLAPKAQNGVAGIANTLAITTGAIESQVGNQEGLDNLGVLFSQYLAGVNSTLQLHGVSVISPTSGGAPVSWLTAAFKTFVTNAILPGHIYEIIFAITLSDLSAYIFAPYGDDVPYVIYGSNNQTVAIFANPFDFSLTPLEAGPSITLTYQGIDTAQINLPEADVTAGTSTGPTDMEQLLLSFRNQAIDSLNDASFQAFLAAVADTANVAFGLKGSTSVLAGTHVGDIPITGIPFNVESSIPGLNSFDGNLGTKDLSVDSGNPTYISIPLTAILDNPSNVTIYTDDVSLPVLYTGNTSSVYVGRAVISPLTVYPGTNNIVAEFRYMPDDPSDAVAENLLTKYLQPQEGSTCQTSDCDPYTDVPITINGESGGSITLLTPYASLQPALAGIVVSGTINGIGSRVVTRIDVYISLNGTVTGALLEPTEEASVEARLYLQDDLPASIGLNSLLTTIYGSTDGTTAASYASLDYTFPETFRVPGATATLTDPGTAVSDAIGPIYLTRGVGLAGILASLPLLDQNLDILNTISVQVGDTDGGYNAPTFLYDEYDVLTYYYLCLTDSTLNDGTFTYSTTSSNAPTGCVAFSLNLLNTSSLGALLESILEILGLTLSSLLDQIPDLIDLVDAALEDPGDDLGEIVNELLSAGDVAEVVSALGTNATLISSVLAAATGTNLATLAEALITEGGTALTDLADTITDSELEDILDDLSTSEITELGTALADSGRTDLESLLSSLTGTDAAALICAVGDVGGALSSLLSSASCSGYTSSAASSVSSAVSSAVSSVSAAVSSAASDVSSAVSSAAASVSSAVASVTSAVASATATTTTTTSATTS